jgi:hypothetical protein
MRKTWSIWRGPITPLLQHAVHDAPLLLGDAAIADAQTSDLTLF